MRLESPRLKNKRRRPRITSATLLTALVGDDDEFFKASHKSGALTAAATYLKVSAGDSDDKDMATALLAQAMLLNRKKMGARNESASRLEALVTDEIRSLMAGDESATVRKIIHSEQDINSSPKPWRT